MIPKLKKHIKKEIKKHEEGLEVLSKKERSTINTLTGINIASRVDAFKDVLKTIGTLEKGVTSVRAGRKNKKV